MASSNRRSKQGLSILIVEDNPVVRDLLYTMLQRSGHNVYQASTGEEALALCASDRPDLAILDDGLPGMSGQQVAEVLGQKLNIPFMVLTAYSDRAKIDRYIALGASNYLVKPVSPDNLYAAVMAAYNNARNISNLLLKSNKDHYIGRAIACLMLTEGHSEETAISLLKTSARSERKKLWCKAREVFETCLQNYKLS